MSHIPPNGPPYYGYPPPPQPAGTYYVPAPVVMPMPVYPPAPQAPPPENPTYVTNYYYQQPPAPALDPAYSQPTYPPSHPVQVVDVPPNGPPYYGYPPPPQPAGTYYVPAPVVMPMPVYPPAPQAPPPENPTYVTNYYYQQPPAPALDPAYSQPTYPPSHPVQVVDGSGWVPPAELMDWVPVTPNTAHTLTERAVKAGHEGWDGSPLWVIRAHQQGDLVPGKLAITHRAAYIPHCGKEVPVHNFDVLCAQPGVVRWLKASNGQVPVGAIAAGNTKSAEPLYIGRVRHMLSLTPGKVHPSHGCCYISYSGNEISYKQYEVLCKIVG